MEEKHVINFRIAEEEGSIKVIDESDPSDLIARKFYSSQMVLLELIVLERKVKDPELKDSVSAALKVVHKMYNDFGTSFWEQHNLLGDLLNNLNPDDDGDDEE